MGFGKITESTDVAGFKKYIGVGNFKVLAVNPNAAELSTIYNTSIDKEPEYLGTSEVSVAGQTKTFKQIRLDFFVQTVEDKNDGIKMIDKVSFFLVDCPQYNRDGSKVRVLNKYGENAWISKDLVAKGEVDQNMRWYNTEGMKTALIGEVEVLEFLKAWLGIPVRTWRQDGVTHEIENPDDARAGLEKIKTYFSGNVAELKNLVKAMPEQMVKILFGVKTTDQGREFQDAFNRMFLKYRNNNFSYLKAQVEDAQDNGAYPNTKFEVVKLKEYEVGATDFSKGNPDLEVEDESDDLPF